MHLLMLLSPTGGTCEGDLPVWSCLTDQLSKNTDYFVPPSSIDGHKLTQFNTVVGDKGKNTLNWWWVGRLSDHTGALSHHAPAVKCSRYKVSLLFHCRNPLWSLSWMSWWPKAAPNKCTPLAEPFSRLGSRCGWWPGLLEACWSWDGGGWTGLATHTHQVHDDTETTVHAW